MTLPTYEPVGHKYRYALQEASGMMRNTETGELELHPQRYMRESDVNARIDVLESQVRMLRDALTNWLDHDSMENESAAREALHQTGQPTPELELTEEDFQQAFAEAMTMSAPQGNFRGGWDACLRVLAAAPLGFHN